MAVVLKPKRSEVLSSAPTTSDLEVGEIAINTADQKLYIRDSGNNIRTIGGGSVIQFPNDDTDLGVITAGATQTSDLGNLGSNTFPDGTFDNVTVNTSLTINGTEITATATELNYVDGVTSNIQTQLDAKAPLASPTFTGGVTIDDDNNYSFGDGTTYIQGSGAADRLKFITNASEAMRIDSSGNLLVGKTSNDVTTAGVNLNSNGYVSSSVSGNPAAYFNRGTSDGNIAQFLKDGTVVGSIGTNSSRIYIGTGDTGIGTSPVSDSVFPVTAVDGNVRDAAIDLGVSGARWKDLYLSGTANVPTLSLGGTEITATATEINYVDGVTSNVQTQLDTKASTGKAIAMAMIFGG